MAAAGGEIPERHAKAAADSGLEVMDGAGKAVGRQPFGQRIGLGEGAVDLVGLGGEDAVQSNSES